jgi:site-specific recombinase XerD
MPDLCSAFREYLAPTRAARTVSAYVAVARRFEEFHSHGAAPTATDVELFLGRARASGRCASAATRNQELAALRTLGRFATERGYWTADPARGVPFAKEPPRDPAVLSVVELQRFFRAAATDRDASRRARNLALLALLSQVGLRVHEVVALDASQVDVASATLVAVRGKGSTVHDVPLSAQALALVAAWLAARPTTLRPVPALFPSPRGERISTRTVQRVLSRLREKVGTAKHVTPHTMRHTTATLALTLGADLSTVGDLLRHTDLNTTRRYLHLVDGRRRDAVRKLSITIPPEVAPGLTPEMGMSDPRTTCAIGSSKSKTSEERGVDAQRDLDDMHNAA